MPDLTPNLQLEKPSLEEFYDVEVQNRNMDKIDSNLTTLKQQVTEHLDHYNKRTSFYDASLMISVLSDQVIPNDTLTRLAFNNLDFNLGQSFVVLSDGSVKIMKKGYYKMEASVQWANITADSSGQRFCNITVNDNQITSSRVNSKDLERITQSPSTVRFLNVDDIVKVNVRQTSGTAISIERTIDMPNITILPVRMEV